MGAPGFRKSAEEGLLSRLQSYFAASYGGRYVECLIKETIQEQPKLGTLLFNVKNSDVLQVEYPFQTHGRTRIADLAFLNAETQRPTCLIEIKYDDHKSPTNARQIQDYRRFCRKYGCKFVFLSQHLPNENLRAQLRDAGRLLLFSDLAEKIRSGDGSVGGLLRRFFVDKGLVMHTFEQRDLANLKAFLFRLLNPWGGQGRSQSKDAMTGGAADAFGNLLRNMNIIAKEVSANASDRSPTIDFELDPWVNAKRVQRGAGDDTKSVSVNDWDAKKGGRLYVYGRIRLDDTAATWLQLEFGVGLEVNSGDRNMHPFTFAAVYSKAFGHRSGYSEQYASPRILYEKQRTATALRKRIREAIKDAVKLSPPKSQIAKLKIFRDSLS